MKWCLDFPKIGDIVRTKVDNFWHYGVFISDNEIIQFGRRPNLENFIKAENVEVLSTNIEEFLEGGFLEVGVLDKKELKQKRATQKIIEVARGSIGEKGYNILHNNCEHFAYYCVFGNKFCSQIDILRNKLALNLLDVYLAKIPKAPQFKEIYPESRNLEINSCTNINVKIQKYYVWKLLKFAIENSTTYKFENLIFSKNENGKWECPNIKFSLSHCDQILVVAISRDSVGVDIEKIKKFENKKFETKILSKTELKEFNDLQDEEKTEFLAKNWTKKESCFKSINSKYFNPQELITNSTKSIKINFKNEEFYLSVSNKNLNDFKIQYVDLRKMKLIDNLKD